MDSMLLKNFFAAGTLESLSGLMPLLPSDEDSGRLMPNLRPWSPETTLELTLLEAADVFSTTESLLLLRNISFLTGTEGLLGGTGGGTPLPRTGFLLEAAIEDDESTEEAAEAGEGFLAATDEGTDTEGGEGFITLPGFTPI